MSECKDQYMNDILIFYCEVHDKPVEVCDLRTRIKELEAEKKLEGERHDLTAKMLDEAESELAATKRELKKAKAEGMREIAYKLAFHDCSGKCFLCEQLEKVRAEADRLEGKSDGVKWLEDLEKLRKDSAPYAGHSACCVVLQERGHECECKSEEGR